MLLESELDLINKQYYETKRVLLTLRIQRTGLLAEDCFLYRSLGVTRQQQTTQPPST